jgi:hypothetical protein
LSTAFYHDNNSSLLHFTVLFRTLPHFPAHKAPTYALSQVAVSQVGPLPTYGGGGRSKSAGGKARPTSARPTSGVLPPPRPHTALQQADRLPALHKVVGLGLGVKV